jgi:hypothetical protein
MKRITNLKNLLFLLLAVLMIITSCSKEDLEGINDEGEKDPRDKYYQMLDSLTAINAGGFVNYSVAVVNGSASALFRNPNNEAVSNESVSSTNQSILEGAIVTASQYGKTQIDTTNTAGLVTFQGFLRGGINVTVQKSGFTSVTYIVNVGRKDSTLNNTTRWMGNIIPVFEVSGPRTANISGRVTIETDLTNDTRERAPNGTKISANILSGELFYNRFLNLTYSSDAEQYFGGEITGASYETGIYGTVNNEGNYSLTVPAATIGLPIELNFSDIVANQKLFETGDPNSVAGGFNKTATYRTIFTQVGTPSPVPASGGARVFFDSGNGATATAAISGENQIEKINVTNGGSKYNPNSPPKIEIVGGGGSGATAAAIVSPQGAIISIGLIEKGSGYTSTPTVNILSGSGASASTTITQYGSVTGVFINDSGHGYEPGTVSVDFDDPADPEGTKATGTPIVYNGRVTGINITDGGSGYTGAPAVTINGTLMAGGQPAFATAQFSGFSVQSVQITNPGSNYFSRPLITFSNPDRPNGVRAEGIAEINSNTGQLVGIQITNVGSGYDTPPTLTINPGSGASAEAVFGGRGVTGITVTNGGENYTYAPKVQLVGGGGKGATATAVVANGRVIGFNIDNPGNGYTSAPTVEIISGQDAQAGVVVQDGKITNIILVNGGHGYTGPPKIRIEPIAGAPGSGATANAEFDAATGTITGIAITNQGEGYIGGNTPAVSQPFSITPAGLLEVKPNLNVIRDAHYGTGMRQPN